MKNLNRFIILIIVLTFSSCNEKEVLNRHFNETDLKTITQIIDYYDSWIKENTNESDISKAYIHFLDSVQPIVIKENDILYLIPNQEKVRTFLSSLDQSSLAKTFNIKDYYVNYNNTTSKWDTVLSPYTLSLNYPSDFVSLVRELRNNNSTYQMYFESIEEEGAIGPGAFAKILLDYREINFNKPEERLVFIITMLERM